MPDGSPTDRLDWIVAVSRTCGHAAIKVAIEIQRMVNRETGNCWPSLDTLARDSGISVRSVQIGIKELESEGFLFCDRKGNGRGLTTHYQAVWSAAERVQPASPFTIERVQIPASKGAESCTLSAEKGAESCVKRVQNPAPEELIKENSEEKSASATESQDLFDGSDTKPVLTDRQLIQPLQGIARWLSSDPERTQTNIATMAALVREFGAQEVERHAKALFRSSGEKSWPEAIGQAIAADMALKRKPRPPPEPEDLTDKLKPKKVTA